MKCPIPRQLEEKQKSRTITAPRSWNVITRTFLALDFIKFRLGSSHTMSFLWHLPASCILPGRMRRPACRGPQIRKFAVARSWEHHQRPGHTHTHTHTHTHQTLPAPAPSKAYTLQEKASSHRPPASPFSPPLGLGPGCPPNSRFPGWVPTRKGRRGRLTELLRAVERGRGFHKLVVWRKEKSRKQK